MHTGKLIELPDGASKPQLEELHTEGRLRGSSFTSSTSSFKSPTIPDSATASTGQDFRINRPPPADILHERLLTVPHTSSPKGVTDHRFRGDSVNGMGTDRSANPQLSWTSTMANSSTGSGGMNMPATSHLILSGSAILCPGSIPRRLFNLPPEGKREPPFYNSQH
jgi:hypothetical protein